MTDSTPDRARLVGINHVALEVGDAAAALEFYGDLFDFEVRGRTPSGVFLDAGDQFLALVEAGPAVREGQGETGGEAGGDPPVSDDHRHFGLVVDDPELVARRIEETDAKRLPTGGLDFRDPWGNRVQVVAYGDVQFTKADHVLDGMGLGDLKKSASAVAELAEKGLAPEEE